MLKIIISLIYDFNYYLLYLINNCVILITSNLKKLIFNFYCYSEIGDPSILSIIITQKKGRPKHKYNFH